MPTTPSGFDWRGLTYSLRWLTILVVLIVVARYGGLGLGRYLDRSESAHAAAIQAPIYAATVVIPAQTEESVNSTESGWAPLPSGSPTSTASPQARVISAFDLPSRIPAAGKAIAADLSAMRVTLFRDGAVVGMYPIISKGKDGSRWQTPVGAYQVESKERNHLSSIGGVFMPYSMQFYGNFFIHGWPYYPDGTPVRLGYTGGCIRLSTADAANVYAFADVTTPLFVFESSSNPTLTHSMAADLHLPAVSADAFLVADVNTGEVFAEKNAGKVRSIASLTKLVTAVVANEAITYDRSVPITAHVMQTLGETFFHPGDQLSATDLLYPLLMQSDNGAATALADAFGAHNFMTLMNDKATALGMNDTYFDDPHGISEHNVSSAEDLFRLLRYIYHNETFLLGITRLPTKSLPATPLHRAYTLANFNVFSGRPEFLGGKTGSTTAARQTMAALFSYPDEGDPSGSSALAIIVLGSDNRKADVTALYDWTRAALKRIPAVASREGESL